MIDTHCEKNKFCFQVYTQFVESILDVHSKYSELIKDVFKADQSFVGALDKACSAVVNYRPVPRQPARAPELVNLFFRIDDILFSALRTISVLIIPM